MMDLKWETAHTYEAQTDGIKFQVTANSMTVSDGILTMCQEGVPAFMVNWSEIEYIMLISE